MIHDEHRPCKEQVALLGAENERLRVEAACIAKQSADSRSNTEWWSERAHLHGKQLAAANALLTKVESTIEEDGPWLTLLYRIRAHLAGQPAAPARTEEVKGIGTVRLDGPKWPCGCPVVGRAGGSHTCPKPTRTEAEQRVLDAMAALDDHAVIVMSKGVYCAWGDHAAKAELARRGLK